MPVLLTLEDSGHWHWPQYWRDAHFLLLVLFLQVCKHNLCADTKKFSFVRFIRQFRIIINNITQLMLFNGIQNNILKFVPGHTSEENIFNCNIVLLNNNRIIMLCLNPRVSIL